MFEKLSIDDLRKLTLVSDGPCISIYFPKVDAVVVPEEFEFIVRGIEKILSTHNRPENEKLLRYLYDFNPAEYIQANDYGIVIFISKYWQGYYLLGHHIPSKVVVAESFHLKPLIGDIQKEESAFILTITSEESILLFNTGESGTELHTFLFQLGQHSNTLHWKHFDDQENINFPHVKANSRSRGSKNSLSRDKINLKMFLRWVEAKISVEKDFSEYPLLVFCSDAVFACYKEVASHPNIHFFKQEPNKLSFRNENILHQANLYLTKTSQERKNKSYEEAVKRIKDKQIVDDLIKINAAALKGNVKTLFLRKRTEILGEINRKNKKIDFAPKNSTITTAEDVLDDIACEVIKHGGEVIVVGRDQMPTSEPAAAILSL